VMVASAPAEVAPESEATMPVIVPAAVVAAAATAPIAAAISEPDIQDDLIPAEPVPGLVAENSAPIVIAPIADTPVPVAAQTPVTAQRSVPIAPVVAASAAVAAADITPQSTPIPQTGYQQERQVCVRCGSTNLTSGYVVDYSEKFRHIHFAPKKMTTKRLNSLRTMRPFNNLIKLDAVACHDCGAVQLVIEPEELARVDKRPRPK
jgi:hypothetical protein